jgi:hypothetical protein
MSALEAMTHPYWENSKSTACCRTEPNDAGLA